MGFLIRQSLHRCLGLLQRWHLGLLVVASFDVVVGVVSGGVFSPGELEASDAPQDLVDG